MKINFWKIKVGFPVMCHFSVMIGDFQTLFSRLLYSLVSKCQKSHKLEIIKKS